MTWFRIKYNDPETGEAMVHEGEYVASENVTAREWAEDHAYTLSDKGAYYITELKKRP